jgi:hypothetical protein
VLGLKKNPRREWRREAPPFSSWVLCPHTLGDSHTKKLLEIFLFFVGASPRVALTKKLLEIFCNCSTYSKQ